MRTGRGDRGQRQGMGTGDGDKGQALQTGDDRVTARRLVGGFWKGLFIVWKLQLRDKFAAV